MFTKPKLGVAAIGAIQAGSGTAVGNSKTQPPTPAIIPVSKSTWWAGVKSGRFPQPVKLGPRITVWRVEDIRTLIRECYIPSSEATTKTVG